MRTQKGQHDPFVAESQAGAVSEAPALQRNRVGRGEVVVMGVERGQRSGRRPGDGGRDLELEPLLTLASGEQPAAAPEEGIVGRVELGGQAQAPQERQPVRRPFLTPSCKPASIAAPLAW